MSRRPAPAAATAVRRAVVTLLSLPVLALLSAGPALAAANDQLGPSEGADLGSGLSHGEAVLIYVGGSLAILLTITALVWLPGMVRSERYRPGRAWGAAPVWFAGPQEAVAAVETATRERGTAGRTDAERGGAHGDW